MGLVNPFPSAVKASKTRILNNWYSEESRSTNVSDSLGSKQSYFPQPTMTKEESSEDHENEWRQYQQSCQEDLEEECRLYCWCDLPILLIRECIRLNKALPPFQDKIAHLSECKNEASPGKMEAKEPTKVPSDFEYDTEVRGSEVDGKPITVYI